MVLGIVQQHRGWIECASEANQGTCFTLYLPRHRQPEEEKAALPQVTSEEPSTYKQGTILIADDEPALRELARMVLEGEGYQVLPASDGKEAVEIYEREGPRTDLVILDLTMPRLSGQDAFHQLLAINPWVRVLFTSGFSKQHVSQADHERILGFISKPFKPDELKKTVRQALDEIRGSIVKSVDRPPQEEPQG
jgi:DNA-binding NtrC family response regulator